MTCKNCGIKLQYNSQSYCSNSCYKIARIKYNNALIEAMRGVSKKFRK